MKRIVLLNPPGKKYYMRDYYCSKISKAAYYYHPADFVILSGILSEDFKVYVLDCIAEKLTEKAAMREIIRINPEIVIFLTGAVSIEEDFPFLENVKRQTNAQMIGAGDVFLDFARDLLKDHEFIDATLLDFTTNDIVYFLKDKHSAFQNIIYKDDEGIVEREERHATGNFSIPLPRHELFKNEEYIFPFSRNKRFSTVMTDFGCPFKCSYCVVNRFNHKEREIDGVVDELKSLNKIGIQEVIFKDQTFAANSKRAKQLCQDIIKNRVKISWTCFSRLDLMDYGLLSLMKRAGCHTIIFGVESSNQNLLYSYSRHMDYRKAKEVFSLCSQLGIETVGTFIIGLPQDTADSIKSTISFSKELGCDYASFNIFTPAYGTQIRRKLIDDRLVEGKICFMDSGVSYPLVETVSLKRKEIWSLRRQAIFSFYLNPRYVLKRIKNIHNFSEISNIFRQAAGLFRNL